MSNEPRSTPTDPRAQPGPSLLNERTVGGIVVHLLGLVGGFVLPGVVYLISTREFTRENARNACNWHLLMAPAFLVPLGATAALIALDSLVGFGEIGAARPVLGFGLVGTFLASMAAVLCSLLFGVVATVKAAFGTAWTYPLAPDLVGRIEARVDGSTAWGAILASHLLVAPATLAFALWELRVGTSSGLAFSVGFGLLVALLLTSLFAPVALVQDVRERGDSEAIQRWLPYVVGPLAVAVLAFVLREWAGSINPTGDAIYAFAGAFWLVAVIYLVRTRVVSG